MSSITEIYSDDISILRVQYDFMRAENEDATGDTKRCQAIELKRKASPHPGGNENMMKDEYNQYFSW